MKSRIRLSILLVVVGLSGCTTSNPEMMGNLNRKLDVESFYMPNAEAARVVSVSINATATASLVVQTHRAAVKEGGPKETIEKFGEVYAFSPNFLAVHRDEPTQIRIWNLQPDDNHTFMLADPQGQVLMSALLPPLQETSYVFTFHQEGLFHFYCAMHPPGMSGQILVLPPRSP
jgi:plastocyanin